MRVCTHPRTGWQNQSHPSAQSAGAGHGPPVVVAPVQFGALASAARRPHAVVAQASAPGHHVGARQAQPAAQVEAVRVQAFDEAE
ncbi:hypothetical protein C1280_14740 [Gemmata obscuriglobus]|uniref:Uncharacterized protein n=1 Tax=Gemmata obscuriglobus TaxID=114 RepID=A0A2Z3H3H1_9BACT|nr:hypothetical protein C1280_14740 [Gemmata obscuriglobus]